MSVLVLTSTPVASQEAPPGQPLPSTRPDLSVCAQDDDHRDAQTPAVSSDSHTGGRR